MPIVIENLTHTYMPGSPFQATAVHDVSLTVGDGEFLGLIGHTGSGKSTLVQHLNGLLRPTAGRVLVDGVDVFAKGTDRRAIRHKVGLVFQYPEHQLFDETVAKDIAFGPHNMGLDKEHVEARVLQACQWVGIDYQALGDRSIYELSGGQMRRVAIAGVLAMQPQVLVLDEPTAGLDPRGREDILTMVQRLHAEQAITVIMVSHSMEDVARLVNRIVVMNKGRVAMDGAPRQIFTRGEELRAMGLDVPEAVRLADALRARGFAIPPEACLPEEVCAAVAQALGEVGAC
ncbi:MAG: energy-coupling factor transporter ATPase [Oscillospiraceae bacterium]|jgi:energy-coupling factor transport system ATP-binding protein|nr:energy-coupling factor transporter ATPase [Oscillospiraceae bacterium]